jgi:hypothetical protein
MTFLNPFVLFGLAAASIPILIHLFNVRKLRTIEFSTLTFLKELNKNKIRRIKIRQWLLLALRTILILLIVLAFSRPALQGTFGMTGTRASSSIVILFDNSVSMSLNNERGRFLTQAQTRASQIVSLLQPDDEVYFLRLTDLPKPTTEQPVRDLTILENLISGTEIGYAYRTIDEGLRTAAGILQRSKNFNKEIYVITDGQQSSFTSSGTDRSMESLFEPNVKIFYSSLASRAFDNISIERVTVPPSLLHVGKPFSVNAVIKNHGATSVRNHLVTILFDGQRVMQKSVSLNSGENTALEFSLTPKRSGALFGSVELENDRMESDDRFLFSVNIPERIDVAVIADGAPYSRYLRAAMDAAAAVDPSSPVTSQIIPPSRMTTAALAQYNVAVITGISALNHAQQDALQQYVRTGGSLFFFPSSDTVGTSYSYLKAMGISDLALLRTTSVFENVDLRFPIFNGMFDQARAGKEVKNNVESPSIRMSVHPRTETSLRSVISLSNGRSFLWMTRFGRGRILGCSVPATNDWSDFPMKGIFVPLMYQSILYLASPSNTEEDHPWVVGERIEFTSAQLREREVPSSILLRDPEGRSVPLQMVNKRSAYGIAETNFLFDEHRAPGIYTVSSGNDTLLQLPVNIRREESDGALVEKNAVADHLALLGVEGPSFIDVAPDSDVASIVSQSRFGIELWKYFLLAAVLVALIEMFIAREPKQQ